MANISPENHKILDLYLKARKQFSLYIYNIKISLAWFFTSNDKIHILTSINELGRLIIALNSKILVISEAKLLARINAIINFKLKITANSALLYRFINTVGSMIHIVTLNGTKALIRFLVGIGVNKVTISGNPTLATLYKLLVYDPQILSDLDVLTLAQMEAS